MILCLTTDHQSTVIMNKASECSVCCITYDESERRPRTLPCGHTFCPVCITAMITIGNLTCPDCRTCHPATAMEQFPLNYGMEAMMQQMKEIQIQLEKPVAFEDSSRKCTSEKHLLVKGDNTVQKQLTGMSKKLQGFLEEQKSNVSIQITGCQDTQNQLNQYRTQLAGWRQQHLQLEERLQSLLQQNIAAVMLIEKEEASVVAIKQKGEEAQKKLEAALESLHSACTAHAAGLAIDHTGQCSVEVEDWRQKCQDLFPDISTITTSRKVYEAIRTALDTVTEDIGGTHTPPHPDPTHPIMDKVKELTSLPEKLMVPQVKEMCRMSQPIARLVMAGQVVAVQEDQGRLRSSKITLDNDRVYLHYLQDQPPPLHTYTMPVCEMVETTLVFMDLGWEGSTRGRVHIRLIPNTPLAQQFILLCTGQLGHCYHNTAMIEVVGKGTMYERVLGGDYDGKGGASLLSITGCQYKQSGKAGSVFAVQDINDYTKGAQFGINTRECSGMWGNVFGDVDSGLEVLQAAVNHNDITQVTVVDCGIVLNQ